MNELEKHEEILKVKLESYEFQFDEANWKKAEQAIEQSRKRKILPFIYMSVMGLLLIGGLYVYYTTKYNAKYAFIANEFKQPFIKETISRNYKEINGDDVSQKTSMKNSEDNDITENSESKVDAVDVNEDKICNNTIAKEKQNVNDNVVLNKKEEANSKKTVSNYSVSKEPKKSSKGNTRGVSEETETNIASDKIVNRETMPTITKTEEKTSAIQNLKQKQVIDNVYSSKGDSSSQISVNLKNEDAVSDLSGNKQPNDSVVEAVETTKKEQLTSDSIKVKDKPSQSNEEDYIKNVASIDIGTDYLFGWKTNDKTEANGINPFVGIAYSHYFNEKIGVQFGLQYNTVSHLSQSTYSVNTSDYDFGLNQNRIDIKYTTLQYVAVPLLFKYSYKEHNQFNIGIHYGYLIEANANMESYQTSSLDLNAKTNLKSEKVNGYTKAFNSNDLRLLVFYRRKLYKDFHAGFGFFYGLSDVKKNEAFNLNNKEKNIGFRIHLSYDFLKN